MLNFDRQAYPYPGFSPGDAVPDEVFNTWYSSVPRNLSTEREPDQIEDLTLRVFTHLHTMADRLNRTAIEAATAPKEGNRVLIQEKYNPRFQTVYPIRPFRKETNFNAEGLGLPTNANTVISKAFAILGNIFLGYENSHEDNRTPVQMQTELNEDIFMWQADGGLNNHYSAPFNNKMNHAFSQASEILKDRINCSANAHSQRITFYALLVLAALSKIFRRSTMTLIFAAATSICLAYILTNYARSSYRQGMLEADLKSSLELAENEARSHRKYLM